MRSDEMNRIRVLDVMALALCAPFIAVTVPPTLSQSREKIHRARCISNMKKLWSAFLAFAEEHDGHLPATGWCGRNYEDDWTWGGNIISVPQINPDACQRIRIECGALWSYATGCARVGPFGETSKGMPDEWYSDARKNVYLCPTAGPVGRKRGLSYSMNYYLEYAYDVLGLKLTAIKNPAETILLLEETELTLNDGCFVPSGFENYFSKEYPCKHAEGTHVLLCDGHVERIDKVRLLKLIKADSEYFRPEVE